MRIDEPVLKKLAKTQYFQALISNKELGLKLFKNDYDLSPLQIHFLGLVNKYNSIYTDIALGDVSPLVMEDEIFVDAYLHYKDHKYSEDKKKLKNPDKNVDKKPKENNNPMKRESKMVFLRPPSKDF